MAIFIKNTKKFLYYLGLHEKPGLFSFLGVLLHSPDYVAVGPDNAKTFFKEAKIRTETSRDTVT
jgi:hypothetical protein